jgi:hypothetical protein
MPNSFISGTFLLMENVVNIVSGGYKTPFHDLHVALFKKSYVWGGGEGRKCRGVSLERQLYFIKPLEIYMGLLVTNTVSNVSTWSQVSLLELERY